MRDDFHRSPIRFRPAEKRIIVAFGDVRGFRSWMRRCGQDQMRRTFTAMHVQWERFAPSATIYKDQGDGFMAIWECRNGHNCDLALSLMTLAVETSERIQAEIEKCPKPRPAGWRIRFVSGDASVWTQKVGRRPNRDYLGPCINLTKELLKVEEAIPVILEGTFSEMASSSQITGAGLHLTPVPYREHPELNMFPDELRDLSALSRLNRAS